MDAAMEQEVLEGGVLTKWWSQVVLNYSEFALTTYLPFIVLVSSYIVFNIPLMLFEYYDFAWLRKYKIQPHKRNTPQETRKCLKTLFFSYFFLYLPLSFAAYPAFHLLGMPTGLPLPSLSTAVIHLIACAIMEDFSHYWFHRLLHTPWLYKHIHSVHHEFDAPYGIAASYAHPLEGIILGFCAFSGPLLFRPHVLVFAVWMNIRQLLAVETHCGYDFPISPHRLLPGVLGGAAFHDYHHMTYDGAFASNFLVWDQVFKTDRNFSIATFREMAKRTDKKRL